MTILEAAPSATADHQTLTDADRLRLDACIEELAAGEAAWATRRLAERAELLGRVHSEVARTAREWVDAASAIKGLDPDSQAVGEEWISGPYPVLSGLGTLAHSLRALDQGRSPLDGLHFGTAPGRRVTVSVLPHSAYERVLMHGFHAEVWMPPGVGASTVRSHAGLAERRPTLTQGIGLVLGAGNITSIAPLDVLYELIANNRVVLLKLNPVMAHMEQAYRRAFAPLIDAGVLRIVQGGAAAGSYLAHHPGISHVHITGSSTTHDIVVFGQGAEGARRKAAGTPLLEKPITSELGGVAPVIVVPGRWTARDLRYQAEHVATMRLHNGGYNCIAGQVVVVSSDWEQKGAFLAELRAALGRTPDRAPWYPGSGDRIARAEEAYPNAEHLGSQRGRLLVDLKQGMDASVIQSTEFFSPVLGVIEVPGTGQSFFDAAVRTANDSLLGTLGANIIADPRDIRSMGAGFREALARLRYGTIAVNTWTGLGFLTAAAPWGAFPGHTLHDVESGRGIVHNALLISAPERTVVTGPFRPFPRSFAHGEFTLFPKPPWFVTSQSAAATGRKLTGFAARPGWLRLPAVFAAAFRA
ncbi:aldehyde dehydrogenase [Subtercola boreus]|uniref:Aldehyde dehydrogenase n=1 Tax=Subtercola boreus TaxID=120213 RepID=A0A3E0VJ61_9MICO|nr:aldehyde dehydrogenase family protein [Subtercola boreus]RFA09751.1 aldehyde dehydrogenase [Subtercola boreus]TQL53141.1 aldehyde dehydrogenase (NAD(P)+) [Subtercola boreus]